MFDKLERSQSVYILVAPKPGGRLQCKMPGCVCRGLENKLILRESLVFFLTHPHVERILCTFLTHAYLGEILKSIIDVHIFHNPFHFVLFTRPMLL